MSHEVLVSEDGFAHIALTAGKPAWHALGQEFDEGTLPSVAFDAAHLNDIVLEKEVLYTHRNGEFSELTDSFNLVIPPWSGNDKSLDLGVVSKNYEVIQNRDLGVILDGLGRYANVDVVGALFKGRVIFATFRGDKFNILLPNGQEDPHEMYLLIYEDKKPGNTVQFILSPVRTVCWNTYRAADEAAFLNIRLSHNKGITDNIQWGVDILKGIASKQTALMNAMQMMAKTPITDAQVTEMVDYVWSMPEMPSKVKMGNIHFAGVDTAAVVNLDQADLGRWSTYQDTLQMWEEAKERVERTREFAIETYYGHETQKDIIGTVHGALNAVTFTTDHYGVGGTGVKVARAAIFGDRVVNKVRAWNRATELVNAN